MKKMKKLLLLIGFASLTMNAQVPSYVPTNGLVGYWPFTGNANDISGNGNNGIDTGTTNSTLSTDRFGNNNSSIYLNSTSQITTSYSGILGGNSRSVNYWMKTTNSNYIVPLAWGSILTQGGRFSCSFNYGNSGVSIDIANSAITYSSNQPVNDNNWHMYTWVFDSSTGNTINFVKIYQDGILLSTLNTSFNPNTIINTTNQNTLGFNGYDSYIDDVGIWNRPLIQQEITDLFNANICYQNITVTDTLIINVGQLSYSNPVTFANNITISPNPASTQININFNNITNLNGGTLIIINSLGQQVATTPITTSGTNSTMQLSTWGGAGMYFVQIINTQGQIEDIKKIILQ